jgi:hypothetical protein
MQNEDFIKMSRSNLEELKLKEIDVLNDYIEDFIGPHDSLFVNLYEFRANMIQLLELFNV